MAEGSALPNPETGNSAEAGGVAETGFGGLFNGIVQPSGEASGAAPGDAANPQGEKGTGKASEKPGQDEALPQPEPDEELSPWTEQLQADLKKRKGLGRFKNPSDITRAYFDLEGKLGTALFPPGENATEEEKQAFREKIGRVKNPKDYDVTFGNDIPADMQENIRKTCFELDLDKEQAKRFTAKLMDEQKAMQGKQAEMRKEQDRQRKEAESRMIAEGQATLKERFGKSYDRNMRYAARAIDLYPHAQDLKEALNKSGILYYPSFIEFLVGIGQKTVEDKFVPGSGSGPASGGDYHFQY